MAICRQLPCRFRHLVLSPGDGQRGPVIPIVEFDQYVPFGKIGANFKCRADGCDSPRDFRAQRDLIVRLNDPIGLDDNGVSTRTESCHPGANDLLGGRVTLCFLGLHRKHPIRISTGGKDANGNEGPKEYGDHAISYHSLETALTSDFMTVAAIASGWWDAGSPRIVANAAMTHLREMSSAQTNCTAPVGGDVRGGKVLSLLRSTPSRVPACGRRRLQYGSRRLRLGVKRSSYFGVASQ